MSEPTPATKDVTLILREIAGGDRGAIDRLVPLVFDEVHRIALARLRGERPGHSLQATAIADEAFVRLVDQRGVEWQDRAHFYVAAAQAIRRILVDHARARNSIKRGGRRVRLPLDEALVLTDTSYEELITIDDALTELARLSARQAKIVELKFYIGLSNREIAEALDVSARTVAGDWAMARAWLAGKLRPAI